MFSLSPQKKVFSYFLLGMFFLHALFMVQKIKDSFKMETPLKAEVIKIKLIQEALQSTTEKKQIVQSEDSQDDTLPTGEAFLSDKNRNFDRQTISQNTDTFKKTAKGNAATTQVAQKVSQTSKETKKIKDIKLSDVGLTASDMDLPKVTRAPASVSEKGLENGDPISDGLSATNDYVQEVALGDFTHLNTVEYKHYGFFHRIRQKLEQFWGNSIQEKSSALFKSGRRMPASQDLVTSLQVTLNDKGEIIGVKILGASGVKELDDAAIESFNMAGPFPNPPKDLLVNGKATIEWGFVVKS